MALLSKPGGAQPSAAAPRLPRMHCATVVAGAAHPARLYAPGARSRVDAADPLPLRFRAFSHRHVQPCPWKHPPQSTSPGSRQGGRFRLPITPPCSRPRRHHAQGRLLQGCPQGGGPGHRQADRERRCLRGRARCGRRSAIGSAAILGARGPQPPARPGCSAQRDPILPPMLATPGAALRSLPPRADRSMSCRCSVPGDRRLQGHRQVHRPGPRRRRRQGARPPARGSARCSLVAPLNPLPHSCRRRWPSTTPRPPPRLRRWRSRSGPPAATPWWCAARPI
jgi:hypothetical protein